MEVADMRSVKLNMHIEGLFSKFVSVNVMKPGKNMIFFPLYARSINRFFNNLLFYNIIYYFIIIYVIYYF